MLRTSPGRSIYASFNRLGCFSLRSISSASRQRLPGRNDEPTTFDGKRTYATATATATAAQNANIAVLGGGLTGLTTAYYLAKQLPPSANITLYEGSDRLGGWIWTEKVQVDVGGKKGTVSFERGPRSLTSLTGNTWRYDDLVMYDLVRFRRFLS